MLCGGFTAQELIVLPLGISSSKSESVFYCELGADSRSQFNLGFIKDSAPLKETKAVGGRLPGWRPRRLPSTR